jgi:hypothetical protein
MNVHLRILITVRFTTGEILRAYGMLGCVVDDDMHVVDDEIHLHHDDMCSEVCKHIHVNLRILITARFTTDMQTRHGNLIIADLVGST